MLLAVHLLALGVGTVVFFGIIILHRRAREQRDAANAGVKMVAPGRALAQGPAVWLAVRSTDSKTILTALGLNYPVPCPWREGITGQRELFIGQPVNGWIIVTGSRLPQPGQDVDACFHFLVRLSHALGHVQFFMADTVRHHHAWVRVERGVATRAYVWMNETVWNQGPKTLAEIELNMKCFNYGEGAEDRTTEESAAANVEKVPALAARWSLDPAALNGDGWIPADGVVGKSTRSHQD
jgi:hypothetical protein